MMSFPTRKPADYDASEKRTLGKGVFQKCDGCGETVTADGQQNWFRVPGNGFRQE